MNNTKGIIHIGNFFDGNLVNSGEFSVVGNLTSTDTLINNTGGIISIGDSLLTDISALNNGDITCVNWINMGVASGTNGKYCISDVLFNTGDITGNIDICDATPNGMFDFNVGSIASSVTHCTAGPCAVPTGVNDENKEKISVSIYPNPAITDFTVSINSLFEQPMTFLLYNVMGEELLRRENIKQNEVIIKTTGIESGIYFYKLETKLQTINTGKIIIE